MRIGIATLMSTIGGPRTVAYNLIKHLTLIDKENKYFIFTDKTEGLPCNENVKPVLVKLASPYTLFFWDQVKLPIQLRKKQIDIFHHTKNVVPEFCPCKSVVTIYDMAPFLFPGTFSRLQRLHLRTHILAAARHADIIITDSASSKNDIVRLTGVEEIKVRVIYLGRAEIYKKVLDLKLLEEFRKTKNLPEPFILYVGTIQPRKNLDIVIRAFHQLKMYKKVPHQLVIVGRRGWLVNDLDLLVKELGLVSAVRFVGAVPDNELPYFYNSADIFVYPSSYEGFGLTPLEAMSCGVPVITSNVSSLPEVVGDAAILVNPRNVVKLANAMQTLLFDSQLRAEYAQKGLERAKQFSWDKTARQTQAIYQELYNK